MARLFISVERLDTWTSENRVSISGQEMKLVELGRKFRIKPAVHFVKANGPDPDQMVGTVRSVEEVTKMGAEHMATSVIHADTAYDVVEGFLGDPVP